MTTFDRILPIAQQVFAANAEAIRRLPWLLVNRDLNGRVRLIAPESASQDEAQRAAVKDLYQSLAAELGPHAYPTDAGVLFEEQPEHAYQGALPFGLPGFDNVMVLDRLATDTRWESIANVANGAPRFVFFSIKGGVGRSTALAASAWSLARQGRRVMVLDLDLESPGLSSALLPSERQPIYGITDWLVEDLVENGDALLADMFATSDLLTAGPIYLVPAHGREPGEYVSKLGRVWMPKICGPAERQSWAERLNRLISRLEHQHRPDVILIDSRAGIDEVAAACVTDLGAHTVFMFAIQGQQTWTGYKSLFAHWQQRGVIRQIRSRLQLVAGLVPDDERRSEYLGALRADAYRLFEETYDEAAPGEIGDWSFEEDDDDAPHSPLAIRWNRGWYGLLSLQQRMLQVDETEVTTVYGALQKYFDGALNTEFSK
ncbi:KGGVGR-motif variant AAA ATPase [Rubrivivax benzoatilyticus]|uniref:ParA family protein n=1 Tax=Rubrivivax benzoatilyticus TaxID=316997 RepID=A0ABX0I0F2_9BURK|nr:ArsA-related P-loop ATPase [Rubrivivax benzoatilyticus]EGJ12182.1 hypothetical protein RBXJA2T_17711 [Rubrivivax benzoatilyticus JA2 = ATCC BAA-35]NHK99326.1 ParA family protein [Rubrivivax benzoatilyticus]NHL25200.1 ParA family protein [Rubrivivax benzoatilyticus]